MQYIWYPHWYTAQFFEVWLHLLWYSAESFSECNLTQLMNRLVQKRNKVASFKRSQCEGCSIIIHLMALYDYYLKYIQGRHIKHTLKLFIWVEPSGRGFKIKEVSYGFSWCHISFLWPKVTETGKVVTVSNFSIRLFILFMSKINRNQENVKFANFRYVIKIYTFVCLKLIGTENIWSQTIVTSLPW